jgi:hypothetical protein
VLLADSEYRHELEADIAPFRGLLMGLFFVSVGMSVALELLLQRPLLVVGLVLGMTGLKILSIGVLGRRVLGAWPAAWELGVLLSQGGEFAFVLFGLAVSYEILPGPLRDTLVLVVSLSMALTPLLTLAYDRLVAPRLRIRDQRPYDRGVEQDTPVIIAGFGRFGQIVGRVLRARGVPFTAMDADPAQIDFLQRFGNKVFYGDASRLDLLRAARADKARLFVLAIDDVQASLRTAREVQEHFPHLLIFARARNRAHAYQLMELGIQHVVRETFLSSLERPATSFKSWASATPRPGHAGPVPRARRAAAPGILPVPADEKKLIEIAERSRRELESLFARDAAEERKSAWSARAPDPAGHDGRCAGHRPSPVLTWQKTYRGILPDSFLDALDVERSAELARGPFRPPPHDHVVDGPGILGFCTAGPSAEPDRVPRRAGGHLHPPRRAGPGPRHRPGRAAMGWLAAKRLTPVLVWALEANTPATALPVARARQLNTRLLRIADALYLRWASAGRRAGSPGVMGPRGAFSSATCPRGRL